MVLFNVYQRAVRCERRTESRVHRGMKNEIERGEKEVVVVAVAAATAAASRERRSLPRCTKILEYVKNRNRVAPARIRLADCDFFVVGPRRTLRVLVPRGNISYGTPPLDPDHHFESSRFTLEGSRSRDLEERSFDNGKRIIEDNRIVENLEEYIERLLREVLNDTMRLFEERDNEGEGSTPEAAAAAATHRDDGYTNRGFDGSATDPDSLDSRIEQKPSNDNENFDCTDSGINSVETSELQTSSRELSLEQSLVEIMDAKFSEISSARDRTIAERDDAIDYPTSLVSSSSLEDEKTTNFQQSNRVADGGGRPESPRPTIHPFQLSKTETLREKIVQRFGRSSRRRRGQGKDEAVTDATSSDPADRSPPPPPPPPSTGDDVGHLLPLRKPLVVFLHGFGSSGQVFHHQLEYFSNLGYPCVAPELLGHGMSSAPNRPRDYRFDKLLGDLEAVLGQYRAFAPGNKCVLVAHNYGCSFASALASKYERNVDRLVLISGGGPTPLAPPSTEGPGRSCLRALLAPLLVCGLRRDLLYSARGRQHPYRGSESIEQRPSHMRYVLDGMIWPEGDCVFHRRITTPTLLIHGLRDDEVSLVQECQMERTIIKAFLDAIPTAGHTPMIDCPERVNHAIHCFVDLWKRKRR